MSDKEVEKKEPEIIWHYTDLQGFLHIMNEGSYFYGTHYRHLSDNQECLETSKLFDDILAKTFNNSNEISKLNQLVNYTYYIGCFSTTVESKSLWKRNEFCIGFDKTEIKKQLSLFNQAMNLTSKETSFFYGAWEKKCFAEVYYNTNDFSKYLRKKIKDMSSATSALKNFFGENTIMLTGKLPDELYELAYLKYLSGALLKKENYKDESEVRLIYCLDDLNKDVKMIRRKPRIKLFPIKHEQMIRHILIKPHDKSHKEGYQELAKLLCDNIGLDSSFVLTIEQKYR